MLKKLRHKKTAKKIWITLAILIVPAFILWGSGSLVRNRETSAFSGRIFGRRIQLSEYKDALEAAKNQAIMQFGEEFPRKELNLESLAWERLILLYETKKRKIWASDREVAGFIQGLPFFQRKGQFDNGIYLQMLQYVFRTPPRVFEEQIRQNIIIRKLYNETTANINVTDEEVKEAFRRLNEQVSLFYIAAQYSDFAKNIAALEEEIKEYYVKNALKFKLPLSFNLEYISIKNEEDEKSIQDKLKGIVRSLNKNTDLAKLAKIYNYSVKATGLFGENDPIPGIGWSQEVLKLISKAKPGELLPLAYIDKSYYIFKLKEKKESYIPDFAEIKDKVKEEFLKDKSEEAARKKIEDSLSKLKEEYRSNPGQVDLEKTARQSQLRYGVTGLFGYGSYIEAIGASDIFWMAAQKLKEGEFSEILYMPSGAYIIKLKSRVPIDENKFLQEKEEFTKRLLNQKKGEYFSIFVKELTKKAQLF